MFHIHRQPCLKSAHDHQLECCDGDFHRRKHHVSIHLLQDQAHEEYRQLLHNEYGARRFPPDFSVHAADDEPSFYWT